MTVLPTKIKSVNLTDKAGGNIDSDNPSPIDLIASNTTDFWNRLGMGQITGMKNIFFSTFATDVTNVVRNLAPGFTTEYPFQTANSKLSIVSTSTADASAGTGARTIFLDGLVITGGLHVVQTEIVTMDGTTPVLTVNDFVEINSAISLTVGSSASNQGIISITHDDSGDFLGQFPLLNTGRGANRLVIGKYTVPSNKFLSNLNVSASGGKSDELAIETNVFNPTAGFRIFGARPQGFESIIQFTNTARQFFPGPLSLEITAFNLDSTTERRAFFIMELIEVDADQFP